MTAADFMQSSIDANSARHAPLFPGVVDFLVADVVLMDCPPASYDVVFSNWLLMYLSDSEVEAFARKALKWLAPGGVLFFRESCFRQSGDKARGGFNPTHYRNPRDYFAAFDGAAAYVDEEEEEEEGDQQRQQRAAAGNGNGAAAATRKSGGSGGDGKKKRTRRVAYFELDVAKCVDTYVAVKGNQNQICWRYVRREADVEVEEEEGQQENGGAPAPRPPRVPAAAARSSSLRARLDGTAYTPAALARYEWTFGGAGFVSPGGPAEARELLLHPRLALAEAVERQQQAGGGGGSSNGNGAAASPPPTTTPARLLDVGCGPGGGAFLASELFPRGALHVHAVDLSVNCVLLALERAAARATKAAAAKAAASGGEAAAAAGAGAGASGSGGNSSTGLVAFGASVTLEVSDAALRWLVGPAPAAAGAANGGGGEAAAATPAAPAAGPFDAAVSRDALLHVRDKAAVLSRLRAWLRPGTGTLLLTDYARPEEEKEGKSAATAGNGNDDGGLAAYAAEREYHLESASGYERLMRDAGFVDVQVEDRTDRLAQHLRRELARLEGREEEAAGAGAAAGDAAASLGPFPGTDAERRAMADRWRSKLARAEAGQQRWLLVTARAPPA